jgi:hypothetical protein
MSVVSGPAIVVRVGDLSSPPGVEAMALARSGMNAARAAVRAASERAEAARLALTAARDHERECTARLADCPRSRRACL